MVDYCDQKETCHQAVDRQTQQRLLQRKIMNENQNNIIMDNFDDKMIKFRSPIISDFPTWLNFLKNWNNIIIDNHNSKSMDLCGMFIQSKCYIISKRMCI